MSEYREYALSLTAADWERAFDGLQSGTEIAVAAGFRHIQLHAAHGYLFNLLIDPRLSVHAPRSIARIERWARELAAMQVESSLRISMESGFLSFDSVGAEFIDSVVGIPVDYLDLSSGFYNINKLLIYPYKELILANRVSSTIQIARRHPGVNFILSGKSSLAWDELLESNISIGICRDLIANPDFLADRSGGCTNRMKCHYYSRGEKSLTCGMWAGAQIRR
jgi:NADPH2 dehydrogenase